MDMLLPNYATRFDSISLTACFLELKGVGDKPRHATGFLWRLGNKIFLITNWHVVTGIKILDGKLIAGGWCPESLVVQYFTKASPQRLDGMRHQEIPTVEIDLFRDFHSPFWLQHSMTFEWGVDIVAIEINKELGDVQCVNDYTYPNLYHFAGSEIFVLGHPLPKSVSKYPISFPVWKRGSIASELLVPWDMRPAFLIDSRTSQGMSGSPVFSRVFGPAAHGDGSIKVDSILTSEFMGVYSGRLHDDENNASLGLVWHRNLIDQIVEKTSAGSREWKVSEVLQKFAPLSANSSPAAPHSSHPPSRRGDAL